ncbi:MAG: FRG domain-containing protein [Sedimentisphaerales bacterium]
MDDDKKKAKLKRNGLNSVTAYLEHVKAFEQIHIAQWFYRGVRNEAYELVPSLFRINIKNTFTTWNRLEAYMLQYFKRESTPFLDKVPQDDLEWFALAQHYGLPTRLLDWSTNPLIALFFAVENYNKEEDSAVWCFGFPSTNNCNPVSTRIDRRLTLEEGHYIIFPNHISPRITNQSGCFTAHDLPKEQTPFVPFNQQEDSLGLFEKIIIKKQHQKDILDELYDIGIHSGLIYPGLDGLSKRIKYEVSTLHKRGFNPKQFERYIDKMDK